MTGPWDKNSHPFQTLRDSLKTTERNSCTHKQRARLWLNCSPTDWGLGHSFITALVGCLRTAHFGSLRVFLLHPNILDLPLSFRQQQTSSGVYGIGVIGIMKAGLEGDRRRHQWRFNHISPARARYYLSTVFLKTLCDMESPDIRALLSSVSVSQCSFASHISLLIPAFPMLRIPPPLFLMTLVLHDSISSPLPLPPLFSLNIVLTPACVCII